jgi:hypothetical protein
LTAAETITAEQTTATNNAATQANALLFMFACSWGHARPFVHDET